MNYLLTLALALSFTAPTWANELDNEQGVINQQKLAKDLPATVVVRVNEKTGKTEVLQTSEKITASVNGQKAITALSSQFVAIEEGSRLPITPNGELDRDTSRSAWYLYFNWGYNSWWGQPSYYYYGDNYNYYPYYNYGWGGYNYYCYNWYGYGW